MVKPSFHLSTPLSAPSRTILDGRPVHFRGAHTTSHGNLVLHVAPPMTASDLLLVAQVPLQFRLKRLLHLPTIPDLLLDVLWHRVVVNQVPLILEEETAVSLDATVDAVKKSI